MVAVAGRIVNTAAARHKQQSSSALHWRTLTDRPCQVGLWLIRIKREPNSSSIYLKA